MYCVKCGVRLQEGVKSCPLCNTPVWCPQGAFNEGGYSDAMPPRRRGGHLAAVAFLTMVLAAACVTCLVVCLNLYGGVGWSGYVMTSVGAVYAVTLLPLWFRHPHPLIFVPISFAAVCGCLLYICLATGGSWFLGFAFPVVMLAGILTTATVAMYRYVKRGRLFITGGLLIAIGGSSMLVELFQHITFGSPMFKWSLYGVSAFGVFGLLLIVAGIIPPLRRVLERKFFV